MTRRSRKLVSVLPSDIARVAGGGERWAFELHTAVLSRLDGWTCVGLGASSSSELCLPEGWRNILGGNGEPPPPFDALSTGALMRSCADASVMIVHQWETRACALARVVRGLRPGVRLATFDHGGSSVLGRKLATYPLPRSDVAAVQSHFAARLTPMRGKRTAMVKGGLSDGLFGLDPSRERCVDFILVGRFEPHKGHLQFLEALPPEATARLVGSAGTRDLNYRHEVLAAAERAGVPVRIGISDAELVREYQAARYIVQVPIRPRDPTAAPPELLGLTLLEGMACGCVPICPSTGPGAEFVRDGVTGFTYEAESTGDLSRVLQEAYVRRGGMGAIEAAATNESLNWTWSAAADNLLTALMGQR